MRVLLVGASGFIGRQLLRALQAEGHQIIATSRSGAGVELPGVRWLPLDLAELGEGSSRFSWPQGTELLINASGVLSTDSRQLTAVQDRGARALFDLAAPHGCRVIQLSALGAGEQPDIPFLASKDAADHHLLSLKLPAVVLRPSLVLGQGGASSGWLTQMSPWPLIPLLDTRARAQPLHVDDLVGAVIGLLRHWPAEPCIIPLVGPEVMTLPQLIDRLRAAQGWRPAHYVRLPGPLVTVGVGLGDRLGWQALNSQTRLLARRDNLASTAPMREFCRYEAAPLESRLRDWPRREQSVTLALRPVMLAVMIVIWLGTALVCLGPGYGWGLRIMAELGVHGWLADCAIISGALADAALGLGLLLSRWRRCALRAQLALMLGYMAIISVLLPHYWFDPFAAVGKNLVLLVATLWLLWTEPARELSR